MRWTPNRRDSTATRRRNSFRNSCSGSSAPGERSVMGSVSQLADLDAGAGQAVDRARLRDLDRAFERRRLQKRVAPQDLLGLDERAIRDASALHDGAAGLEAFTRSDLLDELRFPGVPRGVLGLHLLRR